jgi:hypothetical protein
LDFIGHLMSRGDLTQPERERASITLALDFPL